MKEEDQAEMDNNDEQEFDEDGDIHGADREN